MAKTNFWDDTFEQLAELGTSTAKKTVKSVAKAVNPLQALDQPDTSPEIEAKEKAEKELAGKSHTPLDLQKLQAKYHKSDEQKTAELRKHLFDLVKKGDEEVLAEKKKEEQEKQYQEEQEKHAKKKRETDQSQNQLETPKGKVRKSILGGKKQKSAGMEQHAEYKPSSSKN